MTRLLPHVAPPAITQQVLRVIRQRKALRSRHLRLDSSLSQELGFDLVDVVDIILALELRFGVTIPDEVPLERVADFVRYVAAHAPAARRS